MFILSSFIFTFLCIMSILISLHITNYFPVLSTLFFYKHILYKRHYISGRLYFAILNYAWCRTQRNRSWCNIQRTTRTDIYESPYQKLWKQIGDGRRYTIQTGTFRNKSNAKDHSPFRLWSPFSLLLFCYRCFWLFS